MNTPRILVHIHSPGSGSIKPVNALEVNDYADALASLLVWSGMGYSVQAFEIKTETETEIKIP